jgi:hypothetical protein
MVLPTTLLGLGLQLRADTDAARRQQIATMAGRLGYESVWFSVAPDDASMLDEIDTLLAAGVTHVGAVFTGPPEAAPEWVGIAAAARPGLLVDVPKGAGPDCMAALGGADEWGRRGYVRGIHDPAAAGVVVSSASRAQTAALATAAARARTDARPGLRVGVALGVSIGRTMSEAQARVARDPFLATTGVQEAGLFGTFEQVQEQMLALAAAGADWIRADLADEQDIADLLAQLRGAAVGPAHVLHGRGAYRGAG